MTKRILAVLAAVMMMFSTFTVMAADEVNQLLKNNGFEDGMDSWTCDPGVVVVDDAYEGKKAMYVKTDANMAFAQSQNVVGGEVYEVSVMAKSPIGTEAVVKAEYYGEGGSKGEKYLSWKTTSEWANYKGKLEVPDGTTRASFLFRVIRGGELYWDNVQLIGKGEGIKEVVKRADGDPYILLNGGFEDYTEHWGLSAGAVLVDKAEAHTGEGAIKITTEENDHIGQDIFVVAKESYKVTFWAKSPVGTKAVIKSEFYGESGHLSDEYKEWTTTDTWAEYSGTIVPPEGTVRVSLMFRVIRGGTLYFDDIDVTGKISEDVYARDEAIELEKQKKADEAAAAKEAELDHSPRTPVGAATVFTSDGTFETLDENGNPVNVDAHAGWGGDYVSLTTEEAHSGTHSVKIDTTNGGNPWVRFTAFDVSGGGEYQISFWYKGEIRGDKTFQVKFEGYTDNYIRPDNCVMQTHSSTFTSASEWTRYTYTVKVPRTCVMLWVYPRIYSSNATMYVDDVSMYLVEEPDKFTYNLDAEFYYEDIESSVVTARLSNFHEDIGYTMNYSILDGETVLSKTEGVKFVNKVATDMFSTAPVKENMKEYTMRIDIVKPDGTIEETKDIDIYRIRRPDMMDENGGFTMDGKPIYPALTYHMEGDPEVWKLAAAQGVNVIQFTGGGTPESTIKSLDKLNGTGMKGALVLYHDMKPAGHAYNLAKNKKIVEAVKNHPNLFGYMMMDEPFLHNPEAQDDLKAGYKMVKEIDQVHPCMTCENNTLLYNESIKYMDLFTIDVYPGNYGSYATFVPDYVEKAVATPVAKQFKKPVMNITQVFNYGGSAPTALQLHSMLYQPMIAGGNYFGYYPWVPDNKNLDVMLDESIYWPVISSFHKYEEEIVLSYYNSDKYPTFNKNVETEGNAPYWYESWTDGTNVYMLVLNRQENASEHTLDISVVSDNSLVKLTDYNVEAANPEMVPEGARVTEKYDGGFKATVKAGQAILYKIIPTTPADMSQLALFGDIANYSWAADAINAMYAQGIVNAKGNGLYEPATNITRGDFAMFLINALGLNKDGMFDGNFKDVDPYAEYAVEVAIGRKLGILKGVGDDMFNPETPITRQDLMVICARGMRVAKEFIEADGTQLDAFSDKALIADYAKADMAAMVRDGIVKGNADGTVNPLGNTTRAEAAVIMSRIFSWNK